MKIPYNQFETERQLLKYDEEIEFFEQKEREIERKLGWILCIFIFLITGILMLIKYLEI